MLAEHFGLPFEWKQKRRKQRNENRANNRPNLVMHKHRLVGKKAKVREIAKLVWNLTTKEISTNTERKRVNGIE
jgi:hypothetical protein